MVFINFEVWSSNFCVTESDWGSLKKYRASPQKICNMPEKQTFRLKIYPEQQKFQWKHYFVELLKKTIEFGCFSVSLEFFKNLAKNVLNKKMTGCLLGPRIVVQFLLGILSPKIK